MRDEATAAAAAHLYPGGAALPRDHLLTGGLVPHQVAAFVLVGREAGGNPPDVLREDDVVGVREPREQLNPIPQAVVDRDEHLVPARSSGLYPEEEPAKPPLRVTTEVSEPGPEVGRALPALQGRLEGAELLRPVEGSLGARTAIPFSYAGFL